MIVINGNSCGNCKFCVVGNPPSELVCTRFPPTGHPILGMGTDGAPKLMGKVSMQPIVQATGLCGEHVRKIEAAS
jgi:hypothetical protein